MVTDLVGRALGVLVAPVSGALSFVRRARMFHPVGVLYRAEVFATAPDPAAQRLGGPAIVRFSGAWWKRREWPDVLGLAIRLRDTAEPSAEPAPGDQDLLLATVRRPWTTPFAPLSTRVHDFLANDYYGVSPFEVSGVGRRYLRAVPVTAESQANGAGAGADRAARLKKAVAAGAARLRLEAATTPTGPWSALAEVRLIEPLDAPNPEGAAAPAVPAAVDQAALRFSPFRDGRGLVPRGFVHGLRRAVYAASQTLRPHESS